MSEWQYTSEMQRLIDKGWHWHGRRGEGYHLQRFSGYGHRKVLVAGHIFRTTKAVGNGMLTRGWGVRKTKNLAKGISMWDSDPYERIATLDWMPYKEAQEVAKLLLLSGLES